jgi:hypothetical protein
MTLDPLVLFGVFSLFILGFFAIDALQAKAKIMTVILGAVAMLLAVEVLLAANSKIAAFAGLLIPEEMVGGF